MVAEFALDVGTSIVSSAVEMKIQKLPSYFEQKKIDSKISDIVIAVMEPICIYMSNEGLSEESMRLVIGEAFPYVTELQGDDELLLKHGLNTDKFAKDIVKNKLSKKTRRIVSVYPTVFDTVLCCLIDLAIRVPHHFAEWESKLYPNRFAKLEDAVSTLNAMYSELTSIASTQQPDRSLFVKVVNHRASITAITMSIDGLRQSPIPRTSIDETFVEPAFYEPFHLYDLSKGEILPARKSERYLNKTDFHKSLRIRERLVVVAPAGAGKSTWANWYSTQLLKKPFTTFSIVVQLRNISVLGDLPLLSEIVLHDISPVFHDLISHRDIDKWVHTSKVLLIFDGFDEVSESSRGNVVEWIDELVTLNPNLKTIITSRPLTTNHLHEREELGWRMLYIESFDFHRVCEYIANFQSHGLKLRTGAEYISPEKLALKWMDDITLGPLTGNPLLLTTLLVVHHLDGELPDDRSLLYRRYIDGMLGIWEFSKALAPPDISLTKDQKIRILELLAINMIVAESDAVSENEADEWLNAYIAESNISGSSDDVLKHLHERSGLIVGPGQYTFAHKTIGEYLVANSCVDGTVRDNSGLLFDKKLLRFNCVNDRWTTVTFLWAGLAPGQDTQQFIDLLIDDGEISLAGGLLFDRRKQLERTWVSKTIWRLARETSDLENSIWSEWTFHSLEILSPGKNNIYSNIHRNEKYRCASISNVELLSFDVFRQFIEDGIINPDDWQVYLPSPSPTYWFIIASALGNSKLLENAAPSTLSTDQIYSAYVNYYFSEIFNDSAAKNMNQIFDDMLPHLYRHLFGSLMETNDQQDETALSRIHKLNDLGITKMIISTDIENMSMDTVYFLSNRTGLSKTQRMLLEGPTFADEFRSWLSTKKDNSELNDISLIKFGNRLMEIYTKKKLEEIKHDPRGG